MDRDFPAGIPTVRKANIMKHSFKRAQCARLATIMALSWLVIRAFGQTPGQSDGETMTFAKQSPPEGGLAAMFYLFESTGTGRRPTSKALIAYSVVATNTSIEACFIPASPALSYRVDLFDERGRMLQKTRLGQEYGTQFSSIATQAVFRATTDRRKFRLQAGESEFAADYVKVATPDKNYMPRKLASVGDLFRVREKGQYTLRLQIQAFVKQGAGCQLVTFQPVEFKIDHEP